MELSLQPHPLGGCGLDRRGPGLLDLVTQGSGVECNGNRGGDELEGAAVRIV